MVDGLPLSIINIIFSDSDNASDAFLFDATRMLAT